MPYLVFSSRGKRLISNVLTTPILLNALSGNAVFLTTADEKYSFESSLCSTSNLINKEPANSNLETLHCQFCLLSFEIALSKNKPREIYRAHLRLPYTLSSTGSVQLLDLANFTFDSQAPPKII